MKSNKKSYKSFERDNSMFVEGKTVIDHKIRLQCNLTLTIYIVLVTIMELREGKHKNKGITYGTFWKAAGIKPLHVKRAFVILKEKGLLYKDEQKYVDAKGEEQIGLIQVSNWFKEKFTHPGNFNEFWEIEPKGNKQAALRMYEKALKVKSHEFLCENYKKYLAFCKETDRFTKDTSSWLNPTAGFIDSEWKGGYNKLWEKKDEKQSTNPESLDYDFIKK